MNSKNFSTKSRLLLEFIMHIVIFIASFAGFKIFSNVQYVWPIMYLILICGVLLINSKLCGIVDELSQLVLSKVNSICIKITVSLILVVISLLSTPYLNPYAINSNVIGMILALFLILMSLLRLILFTYFDRKGIYE
ncbi:MAG: hypothetical protein E6649_02035 [Paeniclostridium sordellii]|nr:hypothetical protein [Paeniclostridium sordellii]